jgi:hypothetical protein
MGHRQRQRPAVIIQVGTEAKPADLPAARAPWVHPPSPPGGAMAWWLSPWLSSCSPWRWDWPTGGASSPRPAPDTLRGLHRRICLAAISTSDGKEAGARLSLALRRYVGSALCLRWSGIDDARDRHLPARPPDDDEQHALLRLLGQLDDLRWSPAICRRPLVRSRRSPRAPGAIKCSTAWTRRRCRRSGLRPHRRDRLPVSTRAAKGCHDLPLRRSLVPAPAADPDGSDLWRQERRGGAAFSGLRADAARGADRAADRGCSACCWSPAWRAWRSRPRDRNTAAPSSSASRQAATSCWSST